MSTVPTNPTPSQVERERRQAVSAWTLANSELCTILRPDWAETCEVFGNPGEGIQYLNRSTYAPVTIIQEFYPVHGAWMPQPVAFVITGDTTEYSAADASRLIAALSQAVDFADPVDEEATVIELYKVAMFLGVKPSELLAMKCQSDARRVRKVMARCTACEGAIFAALVGEQEHVSTWMDRHAENAPHDPRWPLSFAMTYSDLPHTWVEYREPVMLTTGATS